jgi:two-component system response regulator MprA
MSNTVLVCDDEPHVTRIVALRLARAGFDVQTAADAEAAWQQLHIAAPSLLILDYRMPGMDGLPFLEQLREDGLATDLPAILLLPPDVELGDDLHRLEALGDVRLVRKPFSARRLVALAREMALLPV